MVPSWAELAEKTLREASLRVRMIATTTPIDLAVELERLRQSWARGRECAPRFTYSPAPDHAPLARYLEALAENLQLEGELGRVYAARALEIVDEAAVCAAVGTDLLRLVARRRFRRRDTFDDAADALARDWLDEPFEPRAVFPADGVSSDDPQDARSLLVRMRAAIGARKLPFRVVVAKDLSALAATGEGFVQIAAGRCMTVEDVERTVLHEIEGHVLPRCRANEQRLGIFALGTRSGVDDQEGRALGIEQRAGFLGLWRRRELALRHRASRMLEGDADFVETARLLLQAGANLTDALRITARVYRGGGLGREVVYLPSFLRVEAALRADPTLDEVLGAGRVSVDAADVLRSWLA